MKHGSLISENGKGDSVYFFLMDVSSNSVDYGSFEVRILCLSANGLICHHRKLHTSYLHLLFFL